MRPTDEQIARRAREATVTDDTQGTPRERHRVVTRRCYYCGGAVRVVVEAGITPNWSRVRVSCSGCYRRDHYDAPRDDDTTTEVRP